MTRKRSGIRTMVCTNCGKRVRTIRNQRASRFGLPPCIDCGHKHFSPSDGSLLNDDLLNAEDAKLERKRHQIIGSVLRESR